jgi:ABC-type phosphate/phosphonate transport system substrate-binding protein
MTVETEFAGSHAQALERLLAGHVDAAATFIGAIEADSRLRVLATTDLIPNEPVIVRHGVRPEKAERVLSALTRLAATPEGKALLSRMADVTGFKPVTNEHYDSVVGVARSAGATVYDLVPAGVQVESRRRGIDLFPL